MKLILSGLEGSGKSYRIAVILEMLVARNSRFYSRYGVTRPIYSNMFFSDAFVKKAKEKKVPILYWHNLDELISIRDADVICDEVGNYFDSRTWTELSLDVRRWITQMSKSGIEFYGTAQDFAQIDISFRRLTNRLYQIKKLVGSRRPSATRPPVRYIWGLCMMRRLNPEGYDEVKSKFRSIGVLPYFFRLQSRYTSIFDTTQRIEKSSMPPFKHELRKCSTCSFEKTYHF